ncbi:hypothetical protein AVEN_50459-1, partial [Araneus ventricosus]
PNVLLAGSGRYNLSQSSLPLLGLRLEEPEGREPTDQPAAGGCQSHL